MSWLVFYAKNKKTCTRAGFWVCLILSSKYLKIDTFIRVNCNLPLRIGVNLCTNLKLVDYRCLFSNSTNSDLGRPPTTVSTFSPFLNTNKVGMLRMPKRADVSGLSSTLTLTIWNLSPYSESRSSRTGAMALQGPHHAAQKSTRTGLSACSTSWSKLASVVLIMLMGITFVNK